MKILWLFAASLLLAACARDQSPVSPSGEVLIAYGTSFGECRGYCSDALTIEKGAALFIRSANDGRPGLTDPVILSAAEYAAIFSAVRWQEFVKLPAIIGCPDCADGGAEWLEISYPSISRRVTFEFGAELAGQMELLAKLREIRTRMIGQIGEF